MSDNQVTEPSEAACFCKHGNLGQHESDCPKCPLHFTRGELNALQRERDQLRADMAKVRDENATLTAKLEQARKERDVLLGRAQLLQRQNEHWVEKLREQEPTMTLLKTEASHLRELINNAPHTNMCVINGPNCSCWKSAARLAAKTEK